MPLRVGPVQPVIALVADFLCDGGVFLEYIAPHTRQQRARPALHDVPGEQRMAQDGYLLDQLPRPLPGEHGRLDGGIQVGLQSRQPGALGGESRRLRHAVFVGWGTELLDLGSDGGQLWAQGFRRVGRLGKNRLDIDAQPPEFLLEIGQVLDRLFRGLDRACQARHVFAVSGRRRRGLRRLCFRLGRRSRRFGLRRRLSRHGHERCDRNQERD